MEHRLPPIGWARRLIRQPWSSTFGLNDWKASRPCNRRRQRLSEDPLVRKFSERFEMSQSGRFREAATSTPPCCQMPLLGAMRTSEVLMTASTYTADYRRKCRKRTRIRKRGIRSAIGRIGRWRQIASKRSACRMSGIRPRSGNRIGEPMGEKSVNGARECAQVNVGAGYGGASRLRTGSRARAGAID